MSKGLTQKSLKSRYEEQDNEDGYESEKDFKVKENSKKEAV